HGVIDGVDETEASVTEANTETSDFFGVGSTFTLTTAIGENVVGTELGDTFNVIGDGADITLNTFDVINGAGGNDTLNLLLTTAGGGLPTTAQMSSVENIHVDATTIVLTALDSSALLDVTSLDVGGFGATAITLGEGQSLTLSNTTAATTTLTVDAEEVATTIHLDGAATATAVTLVGAANTTLDVEGSVAGAGATALTVNAAATTETLDLGLSSDTVVTAAGTVLTTIDASASTGDLGLAASATVETILGGSGVDTIAEGAAGTLVQGGAGADIITLDATAPSDVVINLGDSGVTLATVDTVTGFAAASDHLDFNLADGSATNLVDGGVFSSFLDVLTTADTTVFDGTVQYFFGNDGVNTYVFVDADLDGSADMAVTLVGNIALTEDSFIA
ncbi:hypothetical protein, partial [Mesorhizobium sp. A556]